MYPSSLTRPDSAAALCAADHDFLNILFGARQYPGDQVPGSPHYVAPCHESPLLPAAVTSVAPPRAAAGQEDRSKAILCLDDIWSI